MKVLLLLGVLFTNNAFATQITANGSNDTIKSDNIVNDKALHTSLLVAYEKYKKLAKTDNVRAKVKLFALFFDNAEQLESKSEEAFTFLT